MTNENNQFFDSIYNSRLYSILNASNMDKDQKKKLLKELKEDIEEIPAYKNKTDQSLIISANKIIREIDEELSK